MNASKAEKSRFWVAYFLEDMPVGTKFDHSLLHMTIIPWFVSDKTDEEVATSFKSYFSSLKKFNSQFGKKIMLGSKKRAPVTSIEPSDELLSLHADTLEWFNRIKGRWAVKNPYIGPEFHPHIRHRRGKKLNQDKLSVDSLTLVKARRQEDWIREVAAKADLNE